MGQAWGECNGVEWGLGVCIVGRERGRSAIDC